MRFRCRRRIRHIWRRWRMWRGGRDREGGWHDREGRDDHAVHFHCIEHMLGSGDLQHLIPEHPSNAQLPPPPSKGVEIHKVWPAYDFATPAEHDHMDVIPHCGRRLELVDHARWEVAEVGTDVEGTEHWVAALHIVQHLPEGEPGMGLVIRYSHRSVPIVGG